MSTNRINKVNVGGTEYDIGGSGGMTVGTEAEIEALVNEGELQEGDAVLITDDNTGTVSNPIIFANRAAYTAAYNNGDIPVGAVVVIASENNNDITALQVSYGESNVKDELDGIKEDLSVMLTSVTQLYSGTFSGGDDIVLSDNINNYRMFSIVDANADNEGTQLMNTRYGSTSIFPAIIASIVNYNGAAGCMVLADVGLVSNDGIHYHCDRSAQWNLDGNGVTYFNPDQSASFTIYGYN